MTANNKRQPKAQGIPKPSTKLNNRNVINVNFGLDLKWWTLILTSNDIFTAETATAFLGRGRDVVKVDNVEEDACVSVFTAEIKGRLLITVHPDWSGFYW